MLNEYFALRQTPAEFRLALAARSLSGNDTRTWIHALQGQMKTYEEFQEALLSQYWNKTQQQAVKLSIYQSQYDHRNSTSMVNHYLKFAALSRYLNPPMDTAEFLAALGTFSGICSFPPCPGI
jgi:hypothetical protein